ncbi:ABC transporter transmembrane domain-containing protein [Bartonella sp. DGB2]|uniref:ABC transporter transmembrane domain-containing protein n=1 Tax=Bartonella sp. DGB2 TaxID=3388426 RepID=UPI0039901F6D
MRHILPVQMGALALFDPFLRQQLHRAFTLRAIHQSRMIECFNNIYPIKAQVKEQMHAARIEQTLCDTLAQDMKTGKLNILTSAVSGIFNELFTICIIFFGASEVLQNQMTLGQLIAFHLLAGHVAGPILNLSSLWEQ